MPSNEEDKIIPAKEAKAKTMCQLRGLIDISIRKAISRGKTSVRLDLPSGGDMAEELRGELELLGYDVSPYRNDLTRVSWGQAGPREYENWEGDDE